MRYPTTLYAKCDSRKVDRGVPSELTMNTDWWGEFSQRQAIAAQLT